MSGLGSGKVGATHVTGVLVTFNRESVVPACLDSVLAQTHPVSRLVVLDNASADGTVAMLRDRYPMVEVIESPTNVGLGGGYATALAAVDLTATDAIWFLEDDSTYGPDYVARALAVMAERQVAVVGSSGWSWRRGRWIHWSPSLVATGCPDVVTLDGMVVASEAVRTCGPPVAEYFFMMNDVEYPLRLIFAGFQGLIEPSLPIESRRIGAASGADATAFRAYYQVRNHVAMARSFGGWWMWAGLIRRLVALGYSDLRSDNRGNRIRMRSAGLVDGLIGRMGRTVDPGAARPYSWFRGAQFPSERP